MDYGIYAHVPFCARRCDYCDFFVTIDPDHDVAGFFALLEEDLSREVRRAQGPGHGPIRFDTVYLGGGTPSMVPPGLIRGFLEACRRACEGTADAEVTLEANPETVTDSAAAAWIEAGVTRLSLGVQSLRTDVLRPRGRVYTGDQACAALDTARRAGFRNLGVDLIAGLPGETVDSFAHGVERMISERPDHVSIYLLETDESLKATPLSRSQREGRAARTDDEDLVAMYTLGCDRLAAAGYRHYEISNFCRPDRASRHNLKYWLSDPWIGVGPSACSCPDGRRTSRPADLAAWAEAVRRDAPVTPAGPLSMDPWREALILNLRLVEGVDGVDFLRRWGHDPIPDLDALDAQPGMAGLIDRAGSRRRLTARGRLLSNEVFARLL